MLGMFCIWTKSNCFPARKIKSHTHRIEIPSEQLGKRVNYDPAVTQRPKSGLRSNAPFALLPKDAPCAPFSKVCNVCKSMLIMKSKVYVQK